MAGRAQPFPDRAVHKASVLYFLSFFVVTTEAKLHLLRSFSKEPFEIRCMGVMATSTLAAGYRHMGYLGILDLRQKIRVDLLVAVKAEGRGGRGQSELGV